MSVTKNYVNLFITDHRIGFYLSDMDETQTFKSGHVDLEEGILDNGNIVEPELFFKKLQFLFKQHKVKPKRINFILHDQNILMRDIVIQKEELSKKSIDQYIQEQIGKTIHLPFEKPKTAHYTIHEDQISIKILIIIANDDLLNDYVDVFERLQSKEVIFDLPALDLYNYYLSKNNSHYDHMMMVTLHDRMIMIKILQHGFPVFSMIEDSEESSSQYYDVMENLIERVINYYKYNMNKGQATVDHIAFINMSEDITKKILSDKLSVKFKNHSYQIIEVDEPILTSYHASKVVEMAYLGSIPRVSELQDYQSIPFKLDRVHHLNRIFGYINILTFTLFTLTLLIYIPLVTFREDILNQTNINNILSTQIESILSDIIPDSPVIITEKAHSDAYDFLVDQEGFTESYITLMQNHLASSVTLTNIRVDQSEKTIVFIFQSDSLYDMNNSVLEIYEAHGVLDQVTSIRFITEQPVIYLINNTMMEVTVHYA